MAEVIASLVVLFRPIVRNTHGKNVSMHASKHIKYTV